MAHGCEHRLALLVADLDSLLGSIDAEGDVLLLHFIMFYVEPIREIALGRTL